MIKKRRSFLPGLAFLIAMVSCYSNTLLAAQENELRVLSYNTGLLKVLGADIVPLVDRRAALLPKALFDLADQKRIDILLLQEVWNDRHADSIAEMFRGAGFLSVRPAASGLFGLGSGLLLLYSPRLHLDSWTFKEFTKKPGFEAFTRKGILHANFRLGEQSFAFFGVHMAAVDTKNGIAFDGNQISAYSEQVKDLKTAVNATDTPAIIAGDFNVGPKYAQALYDLFTASANWVENSVDKPSVADDAIVSDLMNAGTSTITWDPKNPLVARGQFPNEPAAGIDHVFTTTANRAAWATGGTEILLKDAFLRYTEVPGLRDNSAALNDTPLSDHYGILVHLVTSQ